MSSVKGATQRQRILVVEDQFPIAMGIETVLVDLGYEVLGPFSKPAPAIEALQHGPVDGAILDANLQGESAVPVADALTAHGIPIILATGYTTENLPEPLRRLPRIEKPFAPADLEKLVRQVMERGRGARPRKSQQDDQK